MKLFWLFPVGRFIYLSLPWWSVLSTRNARHKHQGSQPLRTRLLNFVHLLHHDTVCLSVCLSVCQFKIWLFPPCTAAQFSLRKVHWQFYVCNSATDGVTISLDHCFSSISLSFTLSYPTYIIIMQQVLKCSIYFSSPLLKVIPSGGHSPSAQLKGNVFFIKVVRRVKFSKRN